jgi:sortase A
MPKLYYKKAHGNSKKKLLRLIGFGILLIGLSIVLYVFFPLLSWQIYFAPIFASQNIKAPIPQSTIVNSDTLETLITEASNNFSRIDYTNADNWFPNYRKQTGGKKQIQNYSISIPKLKINNAIVSTIDNDLAKHLVNYGGTAIPAEKGNAVIFGHSTLPQLYNEKDYKTIFTNLYALSPGDKILININNITYRYRVENVKVVDPENTSILEQYFDDSYLTLVTCTPPGTTWKRLAVKARIEKI